MANEESAASRWALRHVNEVTEKVKALLLGARVSHAFFVLTEEVEGERTTRMRAVLMGTNPPTKGEPLQGLAEALSRMPPEMRAKLRELEDEYTVREVARGRVHTS